MNMDSKLTYAMFAVVLAVAIGAYFFPGAVNKTIQNNVPVDVSGTASPAGSTYTTDFAGITMNLANPGANGTSTSLLNNTTQDRYITGIRLACSNIGTSNTAYSGGGLSQWLFSAGTSSIPLPAGSSTAATLGSWTNVMNNFNVPTSTVSFAMASATTQLATSTLAVSWPGGTYLNIIANATNTAVCTFGVDLMGN